MYEYNSLELFLVCAPFEIHFTDVLQLWKLLMHLLIVKKSSIYKFLQVQDVQESFKDWGLSTYTGGNGLVLLITSILHLWIIFKTKFRCKKASNKHYQISQFSFFNQIWCCLNQSFSQRVYTRSTGNNRRGKNYFQLF